jgi:hypothetical protein
VHAIGPADVVAEREEADVIDHMVWLPARPGPWSQAHRTRYAAGSAGSIGLSRAPNGWLAHDPVGGRSPLLMRLDSQNR